MAGVWKDPPQMTSVNETALPNGRGPSASIDFAYTSSNHSGTAEWKV